MSTLLSAIFLISLPVMNRFEFNGNRLSELEKPLYAVYMFKTLFDGVMWVKLH